MKKFYFILVVLPFLLLSCDNSVAPDSNASISHLGKGKVQIAINKANVPTDVQILKAKLTKENENPITMELNINQDTSSNIYIPDLNTGTWKLFIDGLNSNNKVIYSGESDVEVIENKTAQVGLVLNHVGSGMGSIYIKVTWDNGIIEQNGWFDDYGIIIGTRQNSYSCPNVMKEDGIYKMWFSDLRANCIKYATSTNGVNWTIDPIPVITPDDTTFVKNIFLAVSQPKVIKFNGSYYMYYTCTDYAGNSQIGYLATSSDGIHWSPTDNLPVESYNSTDKNNFILSDVLVINNKIYMFYTVQGYNNYICAATSTDGKNFIKMNKPIIKADLFWELNYIYQASVLYEDNKFKLIYTNLAVRNKIGYAESEDLVNWTKNPDPIYEVNQLKNNWASEFQNFCFRKIDGQYKIYLACLWGPYPSIGLIVKK